MWQCGANWHHPAPHCHISNEWIYWKKLLVIGKTDQGHWNQKTSLILSQEWICQRDIYVFCKLTWHCTLHIRVVLSKNLNLYFLFLICSLHHKNQGILFEFDLIQFSVTVLFFLSKPTFSFVIASIRITNWFFTTYSISSGPSLNTFTFVDTPFYSLNGKWSLKLWCWTGFNCWCNLLIFLWKSVQSKQSTSAYHARFPPLASDSKSSRIKNQS